MKIKDVSVMLIFVGYSYTFEIIFFKEIKNSYSFEINAEENLIEKILCL